MSPCPCVTAGSGGGLHRCGGCVRAADPLHAAGRRRPRFPDGTGGNRDCRRDAYGMPELFNTNQ